MKQGDTVPVLIAGQQVAVATVKELSDGTATLVVPATLVVMATKTELTIESPRAPAVETLITGVDRPEASVVEEELKTEELSVTDNSNSSEASTPEVKEEAPAPSTDTTAAVSSD